MDHISVIIVQIMATMLKSPNVLYPVLEKSNLYYFLLFLS